MRIYISRNGARTAVERKVLALEHRAASTDAAVTRAVQRILRDIKRNGDAALLRYAAKFDALPAGARLRISTEDMAAAWRSLPHAQRDALRLAAGNIRAFALRQRPREFVVTRRGVTSGQILRPLDAVGCYVPAGRHPLPSTLLMTVIPAQVAGVPRIAVLCPRPAPIIMAAAHLLGVTEFYRAGGAHAVAALAYGTETILPVDKIAGPGNSFVTTAKQLIACDPTCNCAIDMLAGPTEALIASDTGNPRWIAADLVAQAEHDPDALVIFITTRPALAKQVRAEIKLLSRGNPIARQAFTRNGAIIVARDRADMAGIVNRIAPEHVTLDSQADLSWVRNAGSVFIGLETPQPLGDYISGPNHTLPTLGVARQRGGLSVADFLKVITIQRANAVALHALLPAAITLAESEGLVAHAQALRYRQKAQAAQ